MHSIMVDNIYYSLRPQKNAIIEQCLVLVYQAWAIIDKKSINIYNIK
jgi:hypothetical protein